jgi:uncharacterized RDD family membrane protein YckC
VRLVAESPQSDSTVQIPPEEIVGSVGLFTRALSWVLDAVLINFAAIMAGLGAALVLSIVPVSKDLQPALEAIAGGLYVLWAAGYFIAFWSTTGQTPGARVMQIRLVTANRERVKPARALVRWVGMNLAMVPLFAGYLPILFRRRGFPDWLAHTLVLEAPQLSIAEAQLAHLSTAHRGSATTASPNPAVNPRAATGNSGHPVDPPEHASGGHGREQMKPPEHGHARS